LQVAAASGTKVDVVDRIGSLTTDPTQGTPIDHDFLEKLPVNGRNVESLGAMTPGMSSA